MIKIYHNPRCRKSRETLHIIEEAGHEPEIIEYLKTPPDEEELADLLNKMGKKPFDIVRKGEDIYKQKFKGKDMTDAEWIKALVSHPKLIERPIVAKDDQVVLGRPPETVKQLL